MCIPRPNTFAETHYNEVIKRNTILIKILEACAKVFSAAGCWDRPGAEPATVVNKIRCRQSAHWHRHRQQLVTLISYR